MKSLVFGKLFGAGKDAFYLALDALLYPFLLFLFSPLFIDELGLDVYGIWAYGNSIVALGSLLSFGLSVAVISELSKYMSGADDFTKTMLLKSSSILFLFQGGVVSLIIALLLSFFYSGDKFVALLLYCMILSFVEQIDMLFVSMLRAGKFFSVTLRYDVLVRIIQLVGCYLIAKVSSIEIVLLYFCFFSVCKAFFRFVCVKRYVLSGVKIWPEGYSFNQILNKAKHGWLQGVLGGCMLFSDRIVVGSSIGPEFVSVLTILSLIPQQIQAVSTAAVSSSVPKLSLITRSSKEDFLYARRNIYLLTILIFLLSLVFVAFSFLYSSFFLDVWLGDRLMLNDLDVIFSLLFLAYLLQVVNSPAYFFFLSVGYQNYSTWTLSVSGVVAFIFLVVGVDFYGIWGAVYAKLLYSILSLSMVYFLRRVNA